MSSSRSFYDNCAYVQKTKQSESVGDYMMYPGKYYSDNACRNELGLVGGNDVSLFKGNMVDLESDLRGITRDLSLCSASKYKPQCNRCSKCTDGGLPCGCIACTKQNLAPLPSCQMMDLQNYTGDGLPPLRGCKYPKQTGPMYKPPVPQNGNLLDWIKSFF